MKEFRGLKINGTYELDGNALNTKNDVEISNVTPVELMSILSALVTYVLQGADEKNAPLFLHLFSSVFDKFVKDFEEGKNIE